MAKLFWFMIKNEGNVDEYLQREHKISRKYVEKFFQNFDKLFF